MSVSINKLENEYRKALAAIDTFTADEFIAFAIKLFSEIKVDANDDMLLFQYSDFDWADENGNHFEFDITRQVCNPLEDEPYQLNFTLIYEPLSLDKTEPDDCWSSEFESIEDFVRHIKTTPGYEAIRNKKPVKYNLVFTQC